MKKIEISTLNISIRVLMLDNARFTKAVYNQLPCYEANDLFPGICYDDGPDYERNIMPDQEFPNTTFLGYVREKEGYSIMAVDNGILERFTYNFKNLRGSQEGYYEEKEKMEWIESLGQIFISC